MTSTTPRTGYAPVNGLEMYYKVHGDAAAGAPPLTLLHGSFLTIGMWGELLASLAKFRQVVAVEQQGLGHTADVERPFSYEQMADDAAALLRHLGIEQVDLRGYSLGGGIALQTATRHPRVARKLVVTSAPFRPEGFYPESRRALAALTPDLFVGTPVEAAYLEAAPNPADFPALVAKLTRMQGEFAGWRSDAIRAITAPALVVIGDADIRPEHAVELFGLLGGGVPGDLVGLPSTRLVVLPGTTRVGVMDRAGWLVPMIREFLDAPMPRAG